MMATCSSILPSHFVSISSICDEPEDVVSDFDSETTSDDKIVVDVDFMVCDIYQHLRESEVKKRPCIDYNIDIRMRAILIDWLVEVAEIYMFNPQTLYLAVNYLDRYLSGNSIDSEKLQLLGVTCIMIASKYEDTHRDQISVGKFCDLTFNTEDELLQMEFSVLNFLRFELTVPTVRCFLRRFEVSREVECMTNYLSELSLLDYGMICYAPSLIAASSVFLARYILLPSRAPWNSNLQHYTLYKPSDMLECVIALHSLCCDDTLHSNLPAIRVKYRDHKHMCVANKYCPPSIPREYFQEDL